jgi:hypothetical protein
MSALNKVSTVLMMMQHLLYFDTLSLLENGCFTLRPLLCAAFPFGFPLKVCQDLVSFLQ